MTMAGAVNHPPPSQSGDESLNKLESSLGDLLPPAVDGECMSSIGQLDELGHGLVALLPLKGGRGKRSRNRVVELPRNDQHRSAVRILGIHLGFRPRIQICRSCLKQRRTWSGYCEGLEQPRGFVLADGIGESKTELLERQWYCAMTVQRVL